MNMHRPDVGNRAAGALVTFLMLRGAFAAGERLASGHFALSLREAILICAFIPQFALILYIAACFALTARIPAALLTSKWPLHIMVAWVLAEGVYCAACASYDVVAMPQRFPSVVELLLIWGVTLACLIAGWHGLHSVSKKYWPTTAQHTGRNV